MSEQSTILEKNGLGVTQRRDAWWIGPILTVLGLGAFAIYVPWAGLQPYQYAHFGPYLSPFFSPNLHEMFGIEWKFWPFLILWMPGAFRATCYYYRKAYYRSFFADPPGCAVGEPTVRKYKGETAFPFTLQNLHRYFLYLAIIVLAFLWYDVGKAFFFEDGFHVKVGTLVLLVNVLCLSAFTLGCNSVRHLIGGRLDCFTCSALARGRHKLWGEVSALNARHMEWAWVSLFTVGFADVYIRLCAMGIWTDYRIF